VEDFKIREEFIGLRAQGLSFDKIARKLRKSKQTLIDWSKEFEEEIANLRAVELEALYEKFFLLKEKRIQGFGNILKLIEKELTGRKLADVETDKLLELWARYHILMKDEYTEPHFQSSDEMREEKKERCALATLTRAEKV
jgi:hypothetical protein